MTRKYTKHKKSYEGWGGSREGAGRRPIYKSGAQVDHVISLPSEYWRVIEEAGKGNRSAGIRALIEKTCSTPVRYSG